MGEIFLGKPWHWAFWVILVALLYGLDHIHMHVRWFSSFALLLLGLTAAIVLVLFLTHRKGERITREPFEEP